MCFRAFLSYLLFCSQAFLYSCNFKIKKYNFTWKFRSKQRAYPLKQVKKASIFHRTARAGVSVELLCRLLEVFRSGYYEWLSHTPYLSVSLQMPVPISLVSKKYAMRFTQFRGLSHVSNWVKLKFTAMNLKNLAIWLSHCTHSFSSSFVLFISKGGIKPSFDSSFVDKLKGGGRKSAAAISSGILSENIVY